MKYARGKHPNIQKPETKAKMAETQKKNNHPWRSWNPKGFDGKYLPLTKEDNPML